MNRTDFQHLADVRTAEAAALLAAGLWDGAYYLAGYAVECAMKACIAKLTKAEDFPPDKEKIWKIYSHSFTSLLDAAGLGVAYKTDTATDPILAKNWLITLRWNEQSRYERTPEADARALMDAITDPAVGVLQWIKRYW